MLYQEIKHILKSWLAFARASLTREMEFRGNFLLGILRQILWLSAFLIVIETIFHNTQQLAGWGKAEVIIVLALSRLIEGIADILFTGNIALFPATVQKGQFDYYLIRPLPSQFYTAFHNINIYIVGNVIAGIVLLIWGTTHLSQAPLLSHIVLFGIAVGCALAVLYALLILTASLVFFLERLEALWGFINLYTEPLTVPFDIFPPRLRLALTYILPLAFIAFVPAQVITSRLSWNYAPIILAVTAISLIAANLAWRAGLRRYSSASS